jgi:hypothetical protein
MGGDNLDEPCANALVATLMTQSIAAREPRGAAALVPQIGRTLAADPCDAAMSAWTWAITFDEAIANAYLAAKSQMRADR